MQIRRMFGKPVSLAASIGSEIRFSWTLRFSKDSNRSMPAKDVRRLYLSLNVVMAGSGLPLKDCSDSIMQFDRSNDVSLVRLDRLSGISEKRFDERLRERSVLAKGSRLLVEIEVNALSARLRYFNSLHLLAGSDPPLSGPKMLSL